jgi:HEAT repeat protein/beta-lactamase regulating signal transducer with metallopeptidase domain
MIVFVLLTELLLKSTIVLLAGWLAVGLLRNRSAAARHGAISACFAAALGLPLAALLVPPLHVPGFAIPDAVGAPSAPVITSASRPDAARPGVVRTIEGTRTLPSGGANPAHDAASIDSSEAAGAWTAIVRRSWPQILVAAWLAGGVLLLLRTLGSFAAAARLAASATPALDSTWRAEIARVSSDLDLGLDVPVRVTPRVTVPMALGVFRPVLLLPADANRWSADRRRVVLLHELAHVKRRDCLTQLVGRAACALYWFNPLAWLLASRQLAERERACDDLVLTTGTDAAEYANHLLAIARAFKASRVPAWATVAMARPSQLEGRLLAILDPSRCRLGTSARLSAAAGLLAALSLGSLAAIEPDRPLAVTPVLAPLVAAESPAGLDEPRADVPAPARAIVPTPRPRVPVAPQPPKAPATPLAPEPPVVPVPAVEAEEPVPPPDAPRRASADRRLIDALVTALADQDRSVRVQAAEALAGLNDPRAAGGLTVALKDSDPQVRRAAVNGLTHLDLDVSKGPLLLALADTDAGVREEAMSGLGELGDARHADLFISLLGDPSAGVRRQAARALGEASTSAAVEPLIAALGDADADVRQQAAHALGRLRDRRAVPRLVAALEDADADVRQQAAHALGEIGDPSAVADLVSAVGDADGDVRQQVVHALGELGDPRATDGLVRALADSDPDVIEQAAHALAEVGASAAVPALVSLLSHQRAEVRAQAAFALGEIGDARAVDALTALLRDPDAGVRRAAAGALGELADAIDEK